MGGHRDGSLNLLECFLLKLAVPLFSDIRVVHRDDEDSKSFFSIVSPVCPLILPLAFINELLALRSITRVAVLIYRNSSTLKLPYCHLHEFELLLAQVLVSSYVDLDENERSYSK